MSRRIKTNKKLKNTIQNIFESEIKPMVEKDLLKKRLKNKLSEADQDNFPGKTVTNKTLDSAGKQNNAAMSLVADKIKNYLNFKNNSNPAFPHQNNSKTDYNSPMYRNNSDQKEYIDDWRGMGLEDAQYQTQPNKRFEDQVNDYLEGSTRTGNNTGKDVNGMEVGNVVPSNLGKNIENKVKRKYKKLKSDEWAKAIPNRYGDRKANPNYMVAEALKEITQSVLKEGVKTKEQKKLIIEQANKELKRRKL
tara:strand:+ start:461 stop:1207 length:747 start_codon:yes stop_codon:yes gene_type:complete